MRLPTTCAPEGRAAGLTPCPTLPYHCNPAQPESEPALAELAASSHQLVMITGDAPLTACHAAAHVHIVDRPVLILTHKCGPPTARRGLHRPARWVLLRLARRVRGRGRSSASARTVCQGAAGSAGA